MEESGKDGMGLKRRRAWRRGRVENPGTRTMGGDKEEVRIAQRKREPSLDEKSRAEMPVRVEVLTQERRGRRQGWPQKLSTATVGGPRAGSRLCGSRARFGVHLCG